MIWFSFWVGTAAGLALGMVLAAIFTGGSVDG